MPNPAERDRSRPSGWDRAALATLTLPPLSSVNRLLTVPEVAWYLAVSQRTAWKHINVERTKPGRGLRSSKMGGVRVDPADLRAFIERSKE